MSSKLNEDTGKRTNSKVSTMLILCRCLDEQNLLMLKIWVRAVYVHVLKIKKVS